MSQGSKHNELMDELKAVTRQLGKQLTVDDLRSHSEIDPNNLAFCWGSIQEACSAAWWEVKQEEAQDAQADATTEKQQAIRRAEQKIKQEAIIDWLLEQRLKMGRNFSPIDIKKRYREKYYTALNLFGTWRSVEIEMDRVARQRETEALEQQETQTEPEVLEASPEQPIKQRKRRRKLSGREEALEYLRKVQDDLGIETVPSHTQLSAYEAEHEDAYAYAALVRCLGPKKDWKKLMQEHRETEVVETEVVETVPAEVEMAEVVSTETVMTETAPIETTPTEDEPVEAASSETALAESSAAVLAEILAKPAEGITELIEQAEEVAEEAPEGGMSAVEETDAAEEVVDDVRRIEITFGEESLEFGVTIRGRKYEILLNLENNA